MTWSWKLSPLGAIGAVFVGLLLLSVAFASDDKTEPKSEKLPETVQAALTARFPKAEIDKWTEEKEGDVLLYDIEFKQEGKKLEADIEANGSIHNWEHAIVEKDLPEAARKAVEEKYPKSSLKEIMVMVAVTEGKDSVEGYEILLKTADQKEVEVSVASDGTFLEDSTDEEDSKTPEEE